MATYTKETALYDTAAIAGDISDASTKATNYLSADSSGIMVYDGSSGAQTPSNPSANTNNVFIDSNSLDIRKGTEVLASFGSDVIIGKEDYGHVEISDTGMVVRGNDDGSPITSGDTSNSYLASRSLFVGTGADTATISMGASRTQVWSTYDSTSTDSSHVTYIMTTTNGAVDTADYAQTTISARSDTQDREASVTVSIDDNTNESYAYISADHIQCNGTGLIDIFYPVGSYYETSDTNFNPNNTWGGTWILETAGQVHVSAGTGYSINGALSNTSDGGNKDAIIPYHNHSVSAVTNGISGGGHTHQPSTTTKSFLTLDTNVTGITRVTTASGSGAGNMVRSAGGTIDRLGATNSTTHSHNLPAHNTNYAGTDGNLTNANMQPYIVVNRWHRTA